MLKYALKLKVTSIKLNDYFTPFQANENKLEFKNLFI